jgi:hypothetical protein
MLSPENQNLGSHDDGVHIVGTGAYESPIIANSQVTTPIAERAMVPSPSALPYIYDAHRRTLSHKSTFSTLPEVANSPNPFYDPSPIVCESKSDGGAWRGFGGAATASASDLGVGMATGMGSADTEKEICVNTESHAGSTGSRVWKGLRGVSGRESKSDGHRDGNMRGGASIANSAANRADPISDSNTRPSPTIWGMQRKRFLLLLCGMFFIVAAVAVGVGVGVSVGVANKSNHDSTTGDEG